MGFPAEKKKPSAADEADVFELPNDREQSLARGFEDPSLGDILGEAPISIMAETAEAVHDLVKEVSPGEVTMELTGPAEGFEMGAEPAPAPDLGHVYARMGSQLFSLVASELAFPALAAAGLEILREALGAPAASLLEFDAPHQDFFFRATLGPAESAKLEGFRVPVTGGIAGHVYATRAPVFIPDLSQDRRQLRAIGASVGYEAKSCLAAPLILGGEVYGVLEFFHPVDGGEFNPAHLPLLEEGARMFAKVLEVRFLLAQLARKGA